MITSSRADTGLPDALHLPPFSDDTYFDDGTTFYDQRSKYLMGRPPLPLGGETLESFAGKAGETGVLNRGGSIGGRTSFEVRTSSRGF